MNGTPNLQQLIDAGRRDEAVVLIERGWCPVGSIGARSVRVALEASVRLFAGDLEATISFLNHRHPWLGGQTVMERAEQSDEDTEFVIDMIGAIEGGVHI